MSDDGEHGNHVFGDGGCGALPLAHAVAEWNLAAAKLTFFAVHGEIFFHFDDTRCREAQRGSPTVGPNISHRASGKFNGKEVSMFFPGSNHRQSGAP